LQITYINYEWTGKPFQPKYMHLTIRGGGEGGTRGAAAPVKIIMGGA